MGFAFSFTRPISREKFSV